MKDIKVFNGKRAYIIYNESHIKGFYQQFISRFLEKGVDNNYLFLFYHTANSSIIIRFIRLSDDTSFSKALSYMLDNLYSDLRNSTEDEQMQKLKMLINYINFEIKSRD